MMGWDDPPHADHLRPAPQGLYAGFGAQLRRNGRVAKRDNVIDLGKLEFCVREDLNKVAERRMAVLNPLKVVITNYPEGKTELFTAINNPEDESAGTRQVPFSREIYIERDDFMEVPPKKYYRLSPGTEVRLRYSYLIRCEEVVKDAEGNITELRCTYDPESGNGSSSDGRRVKGVIHWVSAADAIEAEIRLFNPLFKTEDPDAWPKAAVGGQSQPRFDDRHPRLSGTVAQGGSHRAAVPVRARRVFLRRHGLQARTPGIQPHGDPQGFVGQDQQIDISSTVK